MTSFDPSSESSEFTLSTVKAKFTAHWLCTAPGVYILALQHDWPWENVDGQIAMKGFMALKGAEDYEAFRDIIVEAFEAAAGEHCGHEMWLTEDGEGLDYYDFAVVKLKSPFAADSRMIYEVLDDFMRIGHVPFPYELDEHNHKTWDELNKGFCATAHPYPTNGAVLVAGSGVTA